MVTKYIGRTVEIIYQDKGERFSKRRVHLYSQEKDWVKGYCYKAGEMRTFHVNQIYAVEPVHMVI